MEYVEGTHAPAVINLAVGNARSFTRPSPQHATARVSAHPSQLYPGGGRRWSDSFGAVTAQCPPAIVRYAAVEHGPMQTANGRSEVPPETSFFELCALKVSSPGEA